MNESDLRAGSVEKLEPGTVVRILRRCGLTTFTGRLIFRSGPLSCSFFFSEGYIVHGRTNRQELRLGEILKGYHGLEGAEIERALADARARGEMLGMALLRSGAIGPRDLYRCLVKQVELMTEDVLTWSGGVCHVSPDITPGEGVVLLRVPPVRESPPEPPPPPVPPVPPPVPPPAARNREDLTPARAPQASQPARAAEPPPAGTALQSVNEFIRQKEAVRDDDHYGILGVNHDVSAEGIRAAWQQLIRTWHPDRVAHRLLESDLLKLHTILARINAAQAILGDPARRRAYDRDHGGNASVKPDVGRSTPAEDASRLFRAARALMRDENFSQAAEYLRKACQLDPDKPAYHYYLGAAQFKARRYKAAEEALLEAIALDAANPDYLVALGQVYREGKLIAKAAEQFDRALRMDPRHPQALKERRSLREGQRD